MLLVLLALAALMSPEARALLSERHLVWVGVMALALAIWLLPGQAGRVGGDAKRLARHIENRVTGGAVSPLPAPSHPSLSALASNLNRLLEDVEARERSSVDILASNRLLARDFQRVLQLCDSLKYGLAAVDNAGKMIFANRAAKDYLKVPPGKVSGRSADRCLKDPEVLELLTSAGRETQAHGTRTVELAPDERAGRGYIAVSHSCGHDARDAAMGHILLFEDVTLAKNVVKLQTDFIDSVAHELRTPLTTIRGYVEALMEGDADDDPQMVRDFYNIIFQETHRLSELIDNSLNISMMESGAAKLSLTPTRLGRLLEDCLEVIRPQCEEKNIRLAAEFPDRLPVLDIDKRLFNVAVMNLMGNAVKYTPEGGGITLSTASLDKEVTVAIQDTGIGISDDDLPHIFDKFFRSESPDAREAAGSGIGLATARQIVRLHGGEIRVTTKLGAGSKFTISLPMTLVNTSLGD